MKSKVIKSEDVFEENDGEESLSVADNTRLVVELEKLEKDFYILTLTASSRLDSDFCSTLSIAGITSETIGAMVLALETIRIKLLDDK